MPAHAQSVTLDTPNVTVTRPAPGSDGTGETIITFTGTIVNPSDAMAISIDISSARDSSLLFPIRPHISSDFDAWFGSGTANINGATYSGALFTSTIANPLPLGFYNRIFSDPGTMPSINIGWSNGASQRATYTINVVGNQIGSVPEPGIGVTVLAFAGLLGVFAVRRRRSVAVRRMGTAR